MSCVIWGAFLMYTFIHHLKKGFASHGTYNVLQQNFRCLFLFDWYFMHLYSYYLLIVLIFQSVATNLRRSTRKRRISVNLEGYTDSSGSEEDDDLMVSFHSVVSIP